MPLFGKSKEQEKAEVNNAKMNYDSVAHTIHALSHKCFIKCAQNLTNAKLSTSEMVCLDRCTAKYMFTINIVGTRTQEISKKFQNEL